MSKVNAMLVKEEKGDANTNVQGDVCKEAMCKLLQRIAYQLGDISPRRGGNKRLAVYNTCLCDEQ